MVLISVQPVCVCANVLVQTHNVCPGKERQPCLTSGLHELITDDKRKIKKLYEEFGLPEAHKHTHAHTLTQTHTG